MGGIYRRCIFNRVRFPSWGYWYEDMINVFLMQSQAHIAINIKDVLYIKNAHSGNAASKLWSSKNYQCLEQIYLAKSLIQNYRELGLADEDYLFARSIDECSGLAVNRTKKLDIDTRKQIFLACNKIITSFKCNPSKLTPKQKMFYEAIISKDFRAWELAAKITH